MSATVVATAGHVDHGKSTLVHALTGMDPDRFAEEKRRGLTIDLGFAWTALPSGASIALVDVPGHVRFLKNMLAGAGAVDACLFVVDASEGWKPQSEEHLRILDLLGVDHGVIALTKVDLVGPEQLASVSDDLARYTAGTFLADAEVVPVAAPAGIGLDQLRSALDRLLAAVPVALDRGRARLWVDRVFAARGSGTVVTGTLGGGALQVGDEVELAPSGARARIRGLESLGERHDRIEPGQRTAVNLSGLSRTEVERGHAVLVPGRWHRTPMFDARLHVLETLDHDVSRRGAYVAYLGSGEHPARLRVLGADRIGAGTSGAVRVHLATPVPLLPGDRFVLRESGRAETVGGGEVLDVDPVRPASRARPDRSVDRVIAERGFVEAERLELLTGERRAPTVGRWVADPAALQLLLDRTRAAVVDAGPLGLDVATLDERAREALGLLAGVVVQAGRARAGEAADPLASHRFVAELAANPFAPPEPRGVDRGELRELVRRGLVVERDGVWFAASAIDAAAEVAARLLAQAPEGFTVAAARDALGCSRKYALPLLAELDARGVTRRRGDVRIAGPRLPVAGQPPGLNAVK